MQNVELKSFKIILVINHTIKLPDLTSLFSVHSIVKRSVLLYGMFHCLLRVFALFVFLQVYNTEQWCRTKMTKLYRLAIWIAQLYTRTLLGNIHQIALILINILLRYHACLNVLCFSIKQKAWRTSQSLLNLKLNLFRTKNM